jgi:phosphate transport system protein
VQPDPIKVAAGNEVPVSTAIHLEKSVENDLGRLRAHVREMSGHAEHALYMAVEGLISRNRRLAYSVILRDQYIDELETKLDQLCLEFLVRHQPVGSDLRLVFAVLHINRELERIGDYAESIAKQVLALGDLSPLPCAENYVELGKLSVHMLHDATQSFLEGDADLARRTMPIEERANTLRNSINAELAELSRKDQIPASTLTPLQTVARRLERAADQTKNICEEVLYMCTGQFAKHKRADAFRILFFDEENVCLSQMAEGIANALKVPRFVFASAGATPGPVDMQTVEFLRGKGVDTARLVSKSLEQVPDWEESQVVVTLSKRAKDLLPAHSGKTIRLCWDLADPRQGTGSGSERFQACYDYLEAQIRDLAGAILDQPQ